MCRLFGMSGGPEPVRATFWLLQAPDSLQQQSRREPDGAGIGTFDAGGSPVVDKQPLAAYEDRRFAEGARDLESRTFVAHVRYASSGKLTMPNTHPFERDGRLFAHNGVIGDLERLEAELGEAGGLVQGETDSERFFALITREIERTDTDDVGAGIAAAARWVAGNVPVLSINCVLVTASDLWALRYPDTHDLFVLQREAGGGALRHASTDRIRVRSEALSDRPAVVVATERMDDDPSWRPLRSGELLHVDSELGVSSRQIIAEPPAQPLTLADLGERAAASQAGGAR
ncbi:MAG TPA: class II glutamine amidotransferase [Solirubrobacteraceae bacterium]|jgi:glutamine amidotransferase|nr:class II glutamine amidotransferase [Solirubrobacteraceae bacterium]